MDDKYLKPLDPSELAKTCVTHDIGHLGMLAQFCINYCKEFDQIIQVSSSLSSQTTSPVAPISSSSTKISDSESYINHKFKNLKKKFKENELNRIQGFTQTPKKFKPYTTTSSIKHSHRTENNTITTNVNQANQIDRSVLTLKQNSSSSLVNSQVIAKATTFTCSWIMGDSNVVCGKSFSNNDDLNDHIKYHTTSELLSDLNFYYRTKQQLNGFM